MYTHCKVKGTSIAIQVIRIQLSDILSQFTSCQPEYVEGFQSWVLEEPDCSEIPLAFLGVLTLNSARAIPFITLLDI